MEGVEGPGKQAVIAGKTHKMNMIVHQTVRQDIQRILLRIFLEPGKILPVIRIKFKNGAGSSPFGLHRMDIL